MSLTCREDGYEEMLRPDGRRGLWMRGADDSTVELCAGREGDDAYVKLCASQTLSEEDIWKLRDLISTVGFAVEVAEQNAAPNWRERRAPTLWGALNLILLQWFFVRIAPVRSWESDTVGWTLRLGVIPLTGWRSDYRYVIPSVRTNPPMLFDLPREERER